MFRQERQRFPGAGLLFAGDPDELAQVVCRPDPPGEAMTHRWREQVECADLIDRLARDLAAAREPGEDFVQTMWERYPGW